MGRTLYKVHLFIYYSGLFSPIGITINNLQMLSHNKILTMPKLVKKDQNSSCLMIDLRKNRYEYALIKEFFSISVVSPSFITKVCIKKSFCCGLSFFPHICVNHMSDITTYSHTKWFIIRSTKHKQLYKIFAMSGTWTHDSYDSTAQKSRALTTCIPLIRVNNKLESFIRSLSYESFWLTCVVVPILTTINYYLMHFHQIAGH